MVSDNVSKQTFELFYCTSPQRLSSFHCSEAEPVWVVNDLGTFFGSMLNFFLPMAICLFLWDVLLRKKYDNI